MITIVKNLLTTEENIQAYNFALSKPESFWVNGTVDSISSNQFALDKIIKAVGSTVDLSTMAGCEIWTHVNSGPGWHIDRDEIAFRKTGETHMPLCSIVYYISVRDLRDGRFCSDIGVVTPETNMLITFPRGLLHGVEPFQGERIILAVNPWDHIIEVD